MSGPFASFLRVLSCGQLQHGPLRRLRRNPIISSNLRSLIVLHFSESSGQRDGDDLYHIPTGTSETNGNSPFSRY